MKKNPAALQLARFESFKEGKAAQTMHIGPFSEEGPTIERVHSFIEESGGRRVGRHHEIYLSDIRRAAPEKWKTVVRQPNVMGYGTMLRSHKRLSFASTYNCPVTPR